jgi:hypothetical protein
MKCYKIKLRAGLWAAGAIMFGVTGAMAQTVTLQSLLETMTNRDALARLPAPAYEALTASSYNRASSNRNQPDQTFSGWFADGDGTGYLRVETNSLTGNPEWVIMEHQGPGCLTRIWTPFFYYDYNNRTGPSVRIYLDGATQPAFDESLIELVTAQGSIGNPFAAYTARAGDLYLPIPFAQSCKVTLSAAPFYYNVAYRAYTNGTAVETFSQTNYQALAGLRTSVGQNLTAPPAAAGDVMSNSVVVAGGGSYEMALPAGANAIRQFSVQLPASLTNAACLRSTVLAMTFDGEPTVWCPVGDFFSCPDAVHPFQTWQRTVTSNGTLICSWVMPYATSASIQVLNEATQGVAVNLQVTTAPWSWDASSLHFHATWRPDGILPGTPPADWNYVDIQGQGIYVGDSWTVLNIQTNSWWGEGDEKIYVDAAWQNGVPTQFGTGSEDYYGWAGGVLPSRADEFSHPFLANVRVGGLDGCTVGYNINTRTRGLDAIPFQQRLVFDMESSFGTDIRNPWDLLGYAAATFWYARPGATDNRPAQPAAAAKPIMARADLQRMSDAIRYGNHTGNGPGARWPLGEQDASASAGAAGAIVTRDAVGTNDLAASGHPIYSANVPPGGSSLSLSFDGASYYRGTGLSNLFSGIDLNRFSLSCDVYPTALGGAGFSFPVSMGATGIGGGGLAIVEIGGTWEIIHHMLQETSGGPAVALNTWTHLELLRKDFGRGVETHLLVNGTDAGLALTSTPNDPPPGLTIGANPNPETGGGIEGLFQGQIDNVELHNLNPIIVGAPSVSPATTPAGGMLTFSVVATGEPPLSYLWRHNGALLTNAGTASSLTFSNVSSGQGGNYDVVVTNAYGATTSSVVLATVLGPAPVVTNRLAQYRLGDDDPGAVAGAAGQLLTRDAVGTNHLAAQGTPLYSGNVPGGGDLLSMALDGASYYQGSGPGVQQVYAGLDLNDFLLSCDVYPTANGGAGFSFPVSVGGTGSYGGGLAVVEIGGTWELIHHGVQQTSGGPPVNLNAWTHLELQREDFGSGVQTRLRVNGVDAGIHLDSTPAPPGAWFTIGGNPNANAGGIEGLFHGLIDNVALATLSPAPAQLSLHLGSGQAVVQCAGLPNGIYTLWRTLELNPSTWINLQTSTAGLNGLSLLVDSNPPAGQAFYRTSSP